MSLQEDRTSMHSRNLAIVWAPNLLRSREIEAGLAAFTEARVQSVVTEFLIVNGDLLFSEKLQTIQYDAGNKYTRFSTSYKRFFKSCLTVAFLKPCLERYF